MKIKKSLFKKQTAAIMSLKNAHHFKTIYKFIYEYPSGYKIKIPIIHDIYCNEEYVYFLIKGRYWGCRSIKSLQGKKFIIPSDSTPDTAHD